MDNNISSRSLSDALSGTSAREIPEYQFFSESPIVNRRGLSLSFDHENAGLTRKGVCVEVVAM